MTAGTYEIEVMPGTLPPSPEEVHQPGCSKPVLFNPCGLAVAADGVVYISDTGHHRVCKLKDGVLEVLAGSGARGCWDGPGSEAMFAHPCGLAVSDDGMIFVADCGNHRIRMVSPSGEVTTLAGSGRAAYKDGHGRHASFHNPCGLAIDYVSNDILFVSDYSNNCVRAVSRSGLVSTLARESQTSLDSPYGIAVHIDGASDRQRGDATVFVSSYHSHSLAVISPDGDISILAGCGVPRRADGHGAQAAFHAPNGLATDADGTLFVADSGNHCIRRVTRDGRVETLAGEGCPSLTPHGLNSPCGLCVSKLPGRGPVLLIADRSNSCVRLLPVDCVPPSLLAPSTMRADLGRLLDDDDDELCSGEATFNVQGRLLRAPKALLCSRCAHFRAMFASGMRESRGEAVCIPDVAYSTYRGLLDYLLCDVISEQLPAETTLELMMLANSYGVERLEQLCARRLCTLLDVHNVREVGRCAGIVGDVHLSRATERFERLAREQSMPMATEVRAGA